MCYRPCLPSDEDILRSVSAMEELGFFFDTAQSKATQSVDVLGGKTVSYRSIDDTPGHVISGQYLWPASVHVAKYLGERWNEFGNPSAVVELGAGTGLLSIILAATTSATKFVATDHDPGSVLLIEENIELNQSIVGTDKSLVVEALGWGESVAPVTRHFPAEFPARMVVGSDLIYCEEVIEPLFATVAALLGVAAPAAPGEEGDTTSATAGSEPQGSIAEVPIASPPPTAPTAPIPSGAFVLAFSFDIGEASEARVAACAARLGLERRSVRVHDKCRVDTFTVGTGRRID